MANSMQKRKQDLQTREQQMLTQMQYMMSCVLSKNSNNKNRDNNRNRNYQRPPVRGGRSYTPAGRNPNNQSSSVHKYLWTHGACAHTGTNCNTPATGHQEQATFTNMMNGSTTRCYWLPPTWYLVTAPTSSNNHDINFLSCCPLTISTLVPPQPHKKLAILDSGDTGSFFTNHNQSLLTKVF